MGTIGFLLMFFGLLGAGMPIFLVLGTCAAVLLDQRSSSHLQFPIWIYYMALPVGGGLMLARYLTRLFRYLFAFDPRIMTIGHTIEHEAPAELAVPPPR